MLETGYRFNWCPDQIFFTSGGTEANSQVLWNSIENEKKHNLHHQLKSRRNKSNK